jgi:hypothetical protein
LVENRRLHAREHLRTAHETFSRMCAEAFAERARRELLAAGENVRTRAIETRDELTAQEAQIARLGDPTDLARGTAMSVACGPPVLIAPRVRGHELGREHLGREAHHGSRAAGVNETSDGARDIGRVDEGCGYVHGGRLLSAVELIGRIDESRR